MRIPALAVSACLSLASAAVAQTPATSLTLADAAQSPAGRLIVDGATWRCDASGVCTASGGAEQPPERACRRVVARLGTVSAFSWKGVVLSADQLAACNSAAR